MIKGDKFILNIFEYKTLEYIPNDKELEKLGTEGWELCGLINLDNKTTCFFKRKCGELMTIKECP